jgi:PAS domain S-box-containing protein
MSTVDLPSAVDPGSCAASLADLEHFVETLLETLPIPVFYKDLDGRYRGCNRAFEAFTGYARGDVLGKTVHDVAAPEIAERYAQRDRALYSEGGSQEYEWLVRRADGDVRNVRFHKALLTDRLGRASGLLGAYVDITDARRLAAVFENSKIGIMLLVGERRIAMANARLAEIMGYDSPEEMIGIGMREFHLSEARFDAFGADYYEPLRQREQVRVEYQLRRKDGTPVWCLISGTAVDRGRPADLAKGVIWVLDDITARKETERRLRESEHRYRRLVDGIGEVVFRIDRHACWTYVNPAFERVFGRSAAAAAGRPVIEQVHEDDRASLSAALAGLLKGGDDCYRARLRCLRLDGALRWVEIDAKPECDEAGRIWTLTGTLRDVTETKELAEMERRAAFQAGLAEMNASVLHNVGNAITAATHDAAAIVDGARDLGKIADMLERHADSVARAGGDPASRLTATLEVQRQIAAALRCLGDEQLQGPAASLTKSVGHVADLVRIQQHAELDEAHTVVDIGDVVNDALHMLGDLIGRLQVDVRVDIDPDAKTLTTARNQMLQALVNLVKNACDAISQRADGQAGVVRIHTSRDPEGTLVLSVSDNGCGFDGDARRLLRFGFTTKPGGHGFGLYSVVALARACGGDIEMRSDGAGRGTEVRLLLPER